MRPTRFKTRGVALAAVLVLTLLATNAHACPNCQAGETAPTALDSRLGGEHLVSTSVEGRHQTTTAGDMAVNGIRVSDWRLVFGAAWQPLHWLRAAIRIPLHMRRMVTANLAEANVVGLGDLDLAVEAVPLHDDLWFSVSLGARMPTAPRLEAGGVPVDLDAQPGTGAWMPFAGLNFGWRADWGRLATLAAGYLGTSGHFEMQPGHVFLWTAGAWVQPVEVLEFGLTTDMRVESSDVIEGQQDPNSGGWILYLSPSVAWWPSDWARLSIDVRIPIADGLTGRQQEGVIVGFGTRFEFEVGTRAEPPPEAVAATPWTQTQ